MDRITAWTHDHWTGLCMNRGMLPSRKHIDPVAFGSMFGTALPHLWLLDAEGSPPRFRYRLIGGAITAAGALAKPGDYLDQFDRQETLAEKLKEVMRTGRPAYRRGPPLLIHDERIREIETLLLPLASDGREVDAFLNCTVYVWMPGFGPMSSIR